MVKFPRCHSIACLMLTAFFLGGEAVSSASDTDKKMTAKEQKSLGCKITTQQKNCKLGTIPDITVAIKNLTNQTIPLPGSLDGSCRKGRYPHCYFVILGPDGKPVERTVMVCGVMNSLQENDFVQVKKGETFSPYGKGFFGSHQIHPESFAKPGKYKVKFVYCTENANFASWQGTGRFNLRANQPDPKLLELVEKTPKVTVYSNVLEIIVSE